MESEKWSHSSGAISSSPVKDEINKDTGYSTRFKPKVFACIKKAVVFLLAEAQQMFWTFLNRWSWGLEHKTSHDLTKTSKSVISLLFIPATHSRANLVLLHEDSKVFLFLFKQQPALNSAFPRISDRMCTSKRLSGLEHPAGCVRSAACTELQRFSSQGKMSFPVWTVFTWMRSVLHTENAERSWTVDSERCAGFYRKLRNAIWALG